MKKKLEITDEEIGRQLRLSIAKAVGLPEKALKYSCLESFKKVWRIYSDIEVYLTKKFGGK